MTKFTAPQNSFQNGELGIELEGRSDLEQYYRSASKIVNGIPSASGSVSKRPGFELVRIESHTSSGIEARAFKGHYTYVRVGQDDALVGIYPMGKNVDTFPNGVALIRLKEGDVFRGGFAEVVSYVREAYTNKFDMGYGHTWAGMSTQGVKEYIFMDYDAPQAGEYHFTVIGEKVVAVHSSGLQPPMIITYPGGANPVTHSLFTDRSQFTTTQVTEGYHLAKSTPYLDENLGSTTITPSATSGTGVTFTASAALWQPGHFGSLWRIRNGATEGIIILKEVTSNTVAEGNWIVPLGGAATALSTWSESAWNNYQGYPTCVTFFESRVIFGGTIRNPDMIFGSQVNNYFQMYSRKLAQDSASNVSGLNYFGAIAETDAFLFRISNARVTKTTFLAGLRTLFIGTEDNEMVTTGGQEKILSSQTISITPFTSNGSKSLMAVPVNDRIVYIARDGRRMFEFFYSPDNGRYSTREITILNRNLFEMEELYNPITEKIDTPYIQQAVFHKSSSTLWMLVRTYVGGNKLYTCTLDFENSVAAFATQELNMLPGMGTDPKPTLNISSIVVGFEGSVESVYVIAESIQATTVTTALLRLSQPFLRDDTTPRYNLIGTDHTNICKYLDWAWKRVAGIATTSHTGVPEVLRGLTLSCIADGKKHPDVTVASDGTFSTTFAARIVVIGFNYEMYIRSHVVDVDTRTGSAHGSQIRLDRVYARYMYSYGGELSETSVAKEPFLPEQEVANGEVYPLTSGGKWINFPGTYSENARWEFRQKEPVPFTLLSVMCRGDANEV